MFSVGCNGVKLLANGQQILSKCLRKLHFSAILKVEKCETGKCRKRDVLMKQFLNTKEASYLQPSKKQVSSDKKFIESKPIVKPVIDLILEKNCRILEECKKMKGKDDKGKKKKS